MSEEQIKDMILKQCLELTTNNDFRPPISAYDGVDIDDVVRTCKQLQDKKTYLDLVKENKILKENAENNDKVVDKVNWKNMLLKKENKELKKQLEEYKNPIKYFKYANKNVTEENKQLKDNWNKLKECLKDVMNSCDDDDKDFVETILDKMQELEQGSD